MGNRNETQQKIIDAAIKVFGQKGFHGAKTAEIAKEAGVAEGTIFKYYDTKKELLRGVLEYIVHEVVPSIIAQPLEEVLQRLDHRDPKAAIKQILLDKVKIISQNVSCFKIVLTEIQYHEDLKNEYIGQLVPGFIRFMEGMYELGNKKGIFREINAHTAARSFIGMLAITILEKNLLNKDMDVNKEIDGIFDIYLNGVLEKGDGNE